MNQQQPCNWPIAYPAAGPDEVACATCGPLEDLTSADRERVEEMAVNLLWNWSGRRFGTCSVTVRPCRAECLGRPSTFYGPYGATPGGYRGGWLPVLWQGEWFNLRCGSCASGCSCSPGEAKALRLVGPVAEVTEIWINGEILDPAAYVLRDDVLYRTDGWEWPACNNEFEDPQAPDSGAWSITYERGYAVPAGGQIAAYVLACELAKGLCGDNTCQLPKRVSSVTRQGISIAVLDAFEGLEDGRTGIWEIDAWLVSVTKKRSGAPQVFSPDVPKDSGRGLYKGLGRGRTSW